MFPFPLRNTKAAANCAGAAADPREEARRRIDSYGFDSAFSGVEMGNVTSAAAIEAL